MSNVHFGAVANGPALAAYINEAKTCYPDFEKTRLQLGSALIVKVLKSESLERSALTSKSKEGKKCRAKASFAKYIYIYIRS